MMEGTSLIPIFILFLLIIEFVLRKLMFGNFQSKIMETEGESVIKKFTIVFLVIGVSFYIFLVVIAENSMEKWFWLLLFPFVYGSKSFFEWKYNRSSKEYILQIILLIINTISVYFILF
jgi:Domain of unknown function (DUF4181)